MKLPVILSSECLFCWWSCEQRQETCDYTVWSRWGECVNATQCACRDWCFCHSPASKAVSRLMQIEKPSKAGSQTKEGEPHCSSLHMCFGGIIWGFCGDAHWAQMNTESCAWMWVSVQCPFFCCFLVETGAVKSFLPPLFFWLCSASALWQREAALLPLSLSFFAFWRGAQTCSKPGRWALAAFQLQKGVRRHHHQRRAGETDVFELGALLLFPSLCLTALPSAAGAPSGRGMIYGALFITGRGHFSGTQLAGTALCGSCTLRLPPSPSLSEAWVEVSRPTCFFF